MNLLAQSTIGNITPPSQISSISTGTGAQALSRFVSLLILLIITVSAVIFVFMILFAGVQWITSGGNKDKVAAARNKITHAVIGLGIVSLSVVISQTVGLIFGFNIFQVPLP